MPRSPSTSSSCKSAQSSLTPTLTGGQQEIDTLVKTVSCQTQTTPSNSPKHRRKHHHHHHNHKRNLKNGNVPNSPGDGTTNVTSSKTTSSSCQTALSSSASSRDSSRQRQNSLTTAALSGNAPPAGYCGGGGRSQVERLRQNCESGSCDRSRSESRGSRAGQRQQILSPGNHLTAEEERLRMESEEIAAEVQKFFEQNEERIKAGKGAIVFYRYTTILTNQGSNHNR